MNIIYIYYILYNFLMIRYNIISLSLFNKQINII
jgi:hypothetical protein